MTLYHFCAAKHIKSILRHGLDQGGLTEIKPTGFVVHGGWTWLTTDPDPAHQSWATSNLVQYSRTAWRLTIEIPDEEYRRLYDRIGATMLYPSCSALFRGFVGSENWRVFHGTIPKEWIKKAEEMPHGAGA